MYGMSVLSASFPPARNSTTKLRPDAPWARARSVRNAGAANPTVNADIPLRTKGRLSTVEEFRQIVLRAEPDGSLLHLGDVARVELGAQSYAGFTRLSGDPSVTMGVFQLPEANGLEVSAAIRADALPGSAVSNVCPRAAGSAASPAISSSVARPLAVR